MKHPERIADYLHHIAEAIARITGYVQGIDNAAALERDHKTQAAVIRYIEIIGEAANRIQKQEPEFVAAQHASKHLSSVSDRPRADRCWRHGGGLQSRGYAACS